MENSQAVAGYRRFLSYYAENQERFSQLVREGQKPRLMWIGCSDSRVIPETLLGMEPGEMFVLRNIGNLVPPAGVGNQSVGAMLEYGIKVLGIPELVICAHTECGALRALEDPAMGRNWPYIRDWLARAEPVLEAVRGMEADNPARGVALVRAHAAAQRANLLSYPFVQEAVEEGRVNLYCGYWEMGSGRLWIQDRRTGVWARI